MSFVRILEKIYHVITAPHFIKYCFMMHCIPAVFCYDPGSQWCPWRHARHLQIDVFFLVSLSMLRLTHLGPGNILPPFCRWKFSNIFSWMKSYVLDLNFTDFFFFRKSMIDNKAAFIQYWLGAVKKHKPLSEPILTNILVLNHVIIGSGKCFVVFHDFIWCPWVIWSWYL